MRWEDIDDPDGPEANDLRERLIRMRRCTEIRRSGEGGLNVWVSCRTAHVRLHSHNFLTAQS